MHEVRDALSNDARMVPLLRLMARYADASARGQQLCNIALKAKLMGI